MQHPGASSSRRIQFLTPSSDVSMSDAWFDIAGLDHFWIKGRFRVLQKLVPPAVWAGV